MADETGKVVAAGVVITSPDWECWACGEMTPAAWPRMSIRPNDGEVWYEIHVGCEERARRKWLEARARGASADAG